MGEPSQAYFATTKRILRYIKGTKSYGILYETEKDSRLIGHIDSDWT